MPGVGERLKRERESRGKTIEEIAEASGIGRAYFEALEGDDFRALPGLAFGKLYIRAYARHLGFDPQPFIDDYDRERRAALGTSPEPPPVAPIRPRRVEAALAEWRGARLRERMPAEVGVAPAEVLPEGPAAPEGDTISDGVASDSGEAGAAPPASVPSPPLRSPRAVVAWLAVGLVAIAGVIAIGMLRKSPSAVATSAVTSAPPPSIESAPPPAPLPAPEPAKAAGTLNVPEFGVGRRVVNLRLEGAGDAFPEGTRVTFATRVLGGRRGDVIRHVWLWNGAMQQSISLGLGGPDWRTHSAKLILRSGAWAVEARDDAGRVLARSEFTCVPASP